MHPLMFARPSWLNSHQSKEKSMSTRTSPLNANNEYGMSSWIHVVYLLLDLALKPTRTTDLYRIGHYPDSQVLRRTQHSANLAWPFAFTSQPWSLSCLSFPQFPSEQPPPCASGPVWRDISSLPLTRHHSSSSLCYRSGF